MTEKRDPRIDGLPDLPKLPEPDGYAAIAPEGTHSIVVRPDQFGSVNGYAIFTADQMNAHYLKGCEAGSAAAAQAAKQVPDGFVLVPREPTEEMWTAGRDPIHYRELNFKVPECMAAPAWRHNPDGTLELDTSKGTTAVHVWRAMIAAAASAASLAEAAETGQAEAEPMDEARERVRFEMWMVDEGYGPVDRICSDGSPCAGEYENQYWHRSWEAWKAAKRSDASRLSLLTTLAQHHGFESVAKALASLPLKANESNGDGNVR